LFVEDIDRARDFYEHKVGFRFDKGDARSAGFFAGDDFLLLLNYEVGSEMLGPGNVGAAEHGRTGQVLVAAVEDVDAVFAEMQSRGVEFLSPPEDRSWGVRCAYFQDADATSGNSTSPGSAGRKERRATPHWTGPVSRNAA
jgi:catechol 2,3-dioxygenase-like lactoylglutathione lyase family enzyme